MSAGGASCDAQRERETERSKLEADKKKLEEDLNKLKTDLKKATTEGVITGMLMMM